MSNFVQRRVTTVSSSSGRPRRQGEGVEEATSDKPERGNNTRNINSGDTEIPELPPNENLKKNADEAYGDTEIPGRKHDV
jgi:hypothetical protein